MSVEQAQHSGEIGELLTKAREKLLLSQKDIASRLNLKEEIITALDTNNFSSLPAPTYVRGYIRSYARAVDLDADSLISIYEGRAEAPPEIVPDVKPVVQASSRDKPVKAVTYLISLTFMILSIVWWQQYLANPGSFSSVTKSSEGGSYPGGFTYVYDVVHHPETFNPSTSTDIDDTQLKTMEATELARPNDLELDSLLSMEKLTTLDTAASSQHLTLELTAESWIEIYDGLGQKLYVNLAKPGEKINLTGTTPFSVKLGNARVVTVNFKGQIFDTDQYTKAGVARFLLE